jgi:WD40 repeat protein
MGNNRTTALSPDGQTLVTSRFDGGSVALWDVASGSKRLTIAAHAQPVVATAFSSDGRTLATAAMDHAIRLWDVATGKALVAFEGPTQLLALALADDGETILALAGHPQQEKTLTSWNLKTGEQRIDPQLYRGEAWLLASNGRWLATAVTKTSSVMVWDLFPGRERAVFQKIPARVICMAFAPDGSQLAVSDMSGLVTLWNVATTQRQHTFRPAGQTVQGLAFSADGARLAMGQRHATVRLWDVASGKQLTILEGPVKPGSTATVRPMFFSPDGKTLATTESLDNSTVRLWNLPVN